MVRRSGATTSTFCHSLEELEYFKYWSFAAAVELTASPCILATVTAPAFVMVASPDNAAAVNPVPSPIRISVVAKATSEGTPEESAFLTLTVLAAISANLALVTPPSVTLTVTVVLDAAVSRPEPPATVSVSESRSISIVPLSVVMSRSCAVTCESTYALMDCCVASLTAESEAMSSSSFIPVTVAPSPAMFTLVSATMVVPVIAAEVVPPITVPSIVPANEIIF